MMTMKAKVLIVLGILVLLYLRKNKKKAEETKVKETLEGSALSTSDSIDVIRNRLDAYIQSEFAFISPERVHDIVMSLTSNLEDVVEESADVIDYNDNFTDEGYDE